MSVNSHSEESTSQQIFCNAEAKGLDNMITCCLAEAVGKNKYVPCHRFICGIPLSEKLREMCILKGFPFVYNSIRRHYYICLYHRRIIVHEPALQKNELLEKRDLSIYDGYLNLTEDEKLEVLNDPLLKKKLKARRVFHFENDENAEVDGHRTCLYTRQGFSSETLSMKSNIREKIGKGTKDGKSLRYDEGLEGVRTEMSAAHELPMRLLSANTLRRYKKAFQLPHRSGTNTKSQLLEGINEHLATLEVPARETIANFLYQSRMHRNKPELQPNSDASDSGRTS
uniref:SAP30_Sin3_bdg domain-containing protein n=1 Tax=Syphacia muris TaxID=451379 RepID=A0A0N5AP09_9BILA